MASSVQVKANETLTVFRGFNGPTEAPSGKANEANAIAKCNCKPLKAPIRLYTVFMISGLMMRLTYSIVRSQFRW